MVSLEEIAQWVAELPGTEEGTSRGGRTWLVGGKFFAWERPFTKADIKRFGDDPPPRGDILGLRVADLHEKEAVLAEGRRGFFTIPHFEGYAALLVQLKAATKRQVRESLLDAWLACAPAKLAQEHLAPSDEA